MILELNRIEYYLYYIGAKKQNIFESEYIFPSISTYFTSNQKDVSLLMSWLIVITNSWQTGPDSGERMILVRVTER